jgi:cell division protein FtsL
MVKQHLQIVKHWLDKISIHNDKTKKVTENLEIALLNLKIQQAHLGDKARGIEPIADLIEKIIEELHNSTKELINTGRKELRESYIEIEKYINEKEN